MFKSFAPHMTDSYKLGHIYQYPAGTEQVYTNWTPRSDRLLPVLRNTLDGFRPFEGRMVWFGLQAHIKAFLIDAWNESFFDIPRDKAVARYQRRMDTFFGPNAVSADHIGALHDLGYLPIEIRALPEGSRVPMRVAAMTIVNTLPEFYWVTNYLETALSSELWKASTVATIAYEYRRLLDHYAGLTGAPAEFVQWQGHDFSMRGVDGVERAALAGLGHLLSFTGTDTLAAVDLAEDYYGADASTELIGSSVPASEHSVMCMGGEGDEIGTFRRIITEVYPGGIVSVVSDTWDFWHAVGDMAAELKPEILARKPDAFGNAKVVFRPDSGDPVEILCGTAQVKFYADDFGPLSKAEEWFAYDLRDSVADDTPHGERGEDEAVGFFNHEGVTYKMVVGIERNRHDKQFYYIDGHNIKSCEPVLLTPAEKGAVEVLWDTFGGTVTDKGFKLMDSHVGLIYGDSITLERAQQILHRLKAKGFASTNVVFGIGSYTYQYLTRDSLGMAAKGTAGIVNGETRELFKDPITDSGTKKSARGYIRVEEEGGTLVQYDRQSFADSKTGALAPVFRDGVMTSKTTLAEVRARLGALA